MRVKRKGKSKVSIDEIIQKNSSEQQISKAISEILRIVRDGSSKEDYKNFSFTLRLSSKIEGSVMLIDQVSLEEN